MSGGAWALIAIVLVLGGMCLIGNFRPEWFGDPPRKRKPRPIPRKPPAFVFDTTGHVHGASVLVNGVELNSVVGDVEISSSPGDHIPRVVLTVLPCEGATVLLERADIRVHRSMDAIHAAATIRDAAALIGYDRAGTRQGEDLVERLKAVANDLMGRP